MEDLKMTAIIAPPENTTQLKYLNL